MQRQIRLEWRLRSDTVNPSAATRPIPERLPVSGFFNFQSSVQAHDMKLHQLQALVAAVDQGGIRAAARVLHLSQAAVTKSLASSRRNAAWRCWYGARAA